MITTGQWFCDVNVNVLGFTRCYSYNEALAILASLLVLFVVMWLVSMIAWTIDSAIKNYRLRKANRTIQAMAMVAGKVSDNA